MHDEPFCALIVTFIPILVSSYSHRIHPETKRRHTEHPFARIVIGTIIEFPLLSIKVKMCHDSRGVPTHSERVSDQIQHVDQGNGGNGKEENLRL